MGDWPAWSALRRALWPDCDVEHAELQQMLDDDEGLVLLAFDGDGRPLGLVEAGLRHDYVNGTSSSPVGFLEGWYVVEDMRGRGVGKALVAELARWATGLGCTELGSDTGLDNAVAQLAHERCGFIETERVVYYRMPLAKTLE